MTGIDISSTALLQPPRNPIHYVRSRYDADF